MDIDDKTIDKLAKLSMLEFDGNAKASIKEDMNKIINFVAKLDELDTKDVEPMLFVNDDANELRDDIERSDITKEEALENAPKKDSDYFRLPKVMR